MPLIASRFSLLARRLGTSYKQNVVTSYRIPYCSYGNSNPLSSRFASSGHTTKNRKSTLGGHIVSSRVPQSSKQPLKNMVEGHWNPIAKKLASKSSPSILYESPSTTFYVVACSGIGVFCLAWAGWNTYDIFIAPPENVQIQSYVQRMMAVTIFFMVGAAGFFLTRPMRIVRTVAAIPRTLHNGQQTLQIEVQSGLFRRRSTLFELGDLTVSRRLYDPGETRSSAELALESRKNWEKDKERILTLPFRQMWRGFKSFSRLIFSADWIFLHMKDKSFAWKMDKAPAWALDNGKAFDALIKQRI